MASPDTLSIPIDAAFVHEHAWTTVSAHSTSDGRVRYVRCVSCAAWRVDLDRAPDLPPIPHSRIVVADGG